MNNFCLYHAITNDKSLQNQSLETNSRSSKRNGKNFLQSPKSHIRIKQPTQQFNDYTIYPSKQPSKSKKVKLDFKKVTETESLTNPKNKTLKSSRLEQTFDPQYFANEQKTFRTTKSLKNSKQHLNFCQSQINVKKTPKDNKQDDKITLLQGQIQTLSQKIETCQAQSRKNHFEFVLLRDIVEKLRMENLQLTSKMSVYDEFVRTKLQENLENQYLRYDGKQRFKSEQHQHSTLSEEHLTQSVSILKDSVQKKADPKNLHVNQEKSSKTIVSEKPNTQPSQKPNLTQKSSKQISPKKPQSATNQKKQIAKNEESTVKRAKPKKILHFENIFKQKSPKDSMEDDFTEKIEKLLDLQNFQQARPSTSLSVSEENLLESLQMIKKMPVNRFASKKQDKSPLYPFNQDMQEQTSLTYRLSPPQSPKVNRMNGFSKQKQTNSKEVQTQYRQLKSALETLKSKQQYMNPKDQQIKQLRGQKQRIQNALKGIQDTYRMSS